MESKANISQARMKIVVFGITGRMGSELVKAVHDRGVQIPAVITAGVCANADRAQSRGFSFPVISEWSEKIEIPSVLIDFSSPEGSLAALEIAYQHKVPLLVGTTGLPERYGPIFQKVASVVPVIKASNTSVGVSVLEGLVRRAVTQLGAEFEIEISEMHHNRKKDAPSGTALTLGRAASDARSQTLEKLRKDGRSGEGVRSHDEIGFHALRGGDVVGEHTVYLIGHGERVELTHRVTSRSVFAHGAIRAAQWLVQAHARDQKGIFGMGDVINEGL